jgi:hypothetical protein
MKDATTTKRINIAQLSEKAQEQIRTILLREEAKRIISVTPEDIKNGRAWLEGETGGKAWGTNARAFHRVMTKFVREKGTFKQSVSHMLTALENNGNGKTAHKRKKK